MLLVSLTLTACNERVSLGEIPSPDEVYGTCVIETRFCAPT